ncbi:SDR family NAD(P)-dependent oxidoreductase [Actinoalloteichus hymeniacidonis]|uniref:Ketoreductase domain-containing protein n=1 Tax=Actinoalloteichus hymeniacidonis TaxID=340345 RepID=A0AAC9MWE0_9PSEU|nr:SDR family oxidoreductase [Actinoalloteichus hymeniacidonis]AOS60946.1 dehydrogenase of unknown specificity, short-chain alcohol dehydrogenase like [Actinoalloteichus hymeniacidonis]MBB5911053.1 NAD(P)-dependent dehydrogenase (short-subunit alcohol dehydrogenase family) [Actinoalloteichus hymeniacidonis]
MGQLEGKTAVVTGGGTGIGLASAIRLAGEGAHVFITGRREKELTEAAATIGNATAVPGDITDPADVDRLYDQVRERGHGVDVLFANAAAAWLATLDELTEDGFDQTFDLNVKGTYLTVRKALPLLNPGASVILNASTAADNGTKAFGAYAASKAAVRSFARTWANELSERDIRVNAISPGPVDTPGLDHVFGEKVDEMKKQIAANTAVGRLGDPAEVAAAVAFLASPQSSFMVGSNVYVDGGENQV